jgi:hypothetical protein
MYFICATDILAAAKKNGFGWKEGENFDDSNVALRFLMERLDSKGRSSVCTYDSLYLHHSSKPGKADFITKMRPVEVMRSEDAFNALPTGEQKSYWLASLIVHKIRKRVRMAPVYRAYP